MHIKMSLYGTNHTYSKPHTTTCIIITVNRIIIHTLSESPTFYITSRTIN